MLNDGWVKAYRKMLDDPIVCKDGEHLAVWMYIMLVASHADRKMLFNGQKITIKPGQLITGRKKISEFLHISESKVQRILSLFEKYEKIEQQTNSRNRLISIINWSEYQSNEQQLNNKRTTSERLVNTIQECKNDKNEKNNKYGDFFEQIWQLYPVKKGKGSVSDSQKKKLYSIGLEEMTRAIERYKKEQQGTELKFWKHGSTFFKTGYVDYLDANYGQESTDKYEYEEGECL